MEKNYITIKGEILINLREVNYIRLSGNGGYYIVIEFKNGNYHEIYFCDERERDKEFDKICNILGGSYE